MSKGGREGSGPGRKRKAPGIPMMEFLSLDFGGGHRNPRVCDAMAENEIHE